MKFFYTISLFLLVITTANAQVAIGTITPDDGSALEITSRTGALVPPRMTTAQMNLIPTPLDGAVIYNTTDQALYVRSSGQWTSLSKQNGTIILNNDFGTGGNGIITGANNTFINFPIGSSNVLANDTALYTITSNGTITMNQTGNYLFNASFSITNAPAGNSKYIIAVTIDGNLIGYLSRGFTSLPGSDYWGTSGSLVYPVTAGQVVRFQYVFNNNSNALNARFFNLGITKLN